MFDLKDIIRGAFAAFQEGLRRGSGIGGWRDAEDTHHP
jgi:hypothetical protein